MHTNHRFGRTLLAATHLAVYGLVGWAVLSMLAALAGAGVGMLVILVGVVPLALFAYAIAGIARWEDARVAGLFGVEIAPRPLRASRRTDWLRVPETVWLQLTDRRNWIGLGHFALVTLLGSLLLGVVQLICYAVAAILSFAVSGWNGAFTMFGFALSGWTGSAVAAVVIVAGLFACFGIARLHEPLSLSMLVAPAQQAALATETAAAVRRRDDAVNAASIERTRIERDLHDGVQPRLVSVGMTLGMARAKLQSDPEAAAALIDEAHTSTKAAITELRQLARGFHPAVLEDRGLDAALSALAARSPVPVQLDVAVAGRCTPQTESAMYFAIAESITNVAKHSGAGTCAVIVRQRPGGMLWARVQDDGGGGAQRIPGGGIDGVAGRVSAAGGTFTLNSPIGGPTTIEVSLPCAS